MKDIQSLVKRFYMKYYPALLTSSPEESDIHHGKLQKLIGFSGKEREFFDSFFGEKFDDKGEYSSFKNEIFGIGKNKVRYNEHNLKDFNHSSCKNLADIVYNHKIVQRQINFDSDMPELAYDITEENFLDDNCTWLYTQNNENIPTPYSIVDMLAHSGWLLTEVSTDIYEELMQSKEVAGPKHGLVDEATGQVFYDIGMEYPTNTFDLMADEFRSAVYDISYDFCKKVKEHFALHPVIFGKEPENEHSAFLIVLPSIQLARNFDILNFDQSLLDSNYDSTQIIDDYISSLYEELRKVIGDKFAELHHKYETTINIFSNTKKEKRDILMPLGMFKMMTGIDDDDEDSEDSDEKNPDESD